MPEIKNAFTEGKMNKDLDERLVPNGHYIHAVNVEVTTSEDSDVGTVQNIYGNLGMSGNEHVPTNSVCVGTISDESNDNLYWLTATDKISVMQKLLDDGYEFFTGVPDSGLKPLILQVKSCIRKNSEMLYIMGLGYQTLKDISAKLDAQHILWVETIYEVQQLDKITLRQQ